MTTLAPEPKFDTVRGLAVHLRIWAQLLDNREICGAPGLVQMASAEVASSQTAAASGHPIDETMKILDTYIPRCGDVSAGAINA